jgi:hypothetical protein
MDFNWEAIEPRFRFIRRDYPTTMLKCHFDYILVSFAQHKMLTLPTTAFIAFRFHSDHSAHFYVHFFDLVELPFPFQPIKKFSAWDLDDLMT